MSSVYSKLESVKNYYRHKKPLETGFKLSFGSRGVGKTTLMAKRYLKWLKGKTRGRYVHHNYYSNVKFTIEHQDYHYLNLSQYKLTDYIERNPVTEKYHCYTDPTDRGLSQTPFKIKPDSVVDIDEIGILYHSRQYKNLDQELINYTKVLRKLNVIFYCCSQNYDIDKQLRLTANELTLQQKIIHINIARQIRKFIAINNSVDSTGNAESQIVDRVEFMPILKRGAIRLTYIPFYTGLFDSFD